MADRIDVTIDVFDEMGQRAQVRTNVTVKALMREIADEFEGIELDDLDNFVMTRKPSDKPLDAILTLPELNIRDGDALVFKYKQNHTLRQPISGNKKARLVDTVTGITFDLAWQPAIIGRREGMALSELLAVDLTYDVNAMRISRMHAQITEQDGRWFIERLTNSNPMYIDGKAVQYGEKVELEEGNVIQPGRKSIQLQFSKNR